MRRRLKELAILLFGLAAIGALVLVSGIVPIKASSGHWAITKWVLEFAKRRSVDLHSSGIVVPPLDDPDIVRLGAATYQSNCQWCHGLPGMPQPVVPAKMTPQPPPLDGSAIKWKTEELFYIIKHGIKFTGMPAWPAPSRDDEIWPVVAFLQSLAETGTRSYEQPNDSTVQTDSEVSQWVARSCSVCHDFDGTSRAGPRVPLLAGQSEDYLRASLRAYRTGNRHSGVMQPIAARLNDEQLSKLATYYANQEPERTESKLPSTTTTEATEAARKLVMEGDRAKKIPSCVDCHGPGLAVRSSEYPNLVGQGASYIRRQLQLLKSKSRGGTSRVNLMHPIADKLTEPQIRALADYYEQAGE